MPSIGLYKIELFFFCFLSNCLLASEAVIGDTQGHKICSVVLPIYTVLVDVKRCVHFYVMGSVGGKGKFRIQVRVK
jgi:hypothetical protein